jgi:uncharacterized protein YxeA
MKHVAVVFAVLAAALGTAASGSAAEIKPMGQSFAFQKHHQRRATASQRNALRAAESYLEYTAFSKIGLEKQLKFEGYSSSAARYGATHVGANWYHQAAKAAKAYLEYTSFSKSGLQQQLEFEGFTSAQARFGVRKAYH